MDKVLLQGHLSPEWVRRSYVNLDTIMSHAYGVENAPLLSNNDLDTAFDEGILVTTCGNQITIHVTANAFVDFPKLLRYAELCGGRETGVVKIILPDELCKSTPTPTANGAQLKFQLMKASHEPEPVACSPSVFKIQSMSESKKDAYHIRKMMDKTHSEAAKESANAEANKNDSTATFMEYCMNVHADKKRREALGCVDLKMGEFEGNLLLESKDKKWLDTRFFVSKAPGTVFPLAVEGHAAHSITYHHTGADKVWYIVKPSDFHRIEEHVWNNNTRVKLEGDEPQCSQFVRHESIYVEPEYLATGVDFTRVVQKAGEMVIIFPFAYHQGFNAGANIAETQVYGDEHWANIFAQNPDWHLPCGRECKGKGLWKPETISLDFLGKSVRFADQAPVEVEDGDGKGFVFASDGPFDYSRAGELTQFGTSRIPFSHSELAHPAIDESFYEPIEAFSPLFVSPEPDHVVAEE